MVTVSLVFNCYYTVGYSSMYYDLRFFYFKLYLILEYKSPLQGKAGADFLEFSSLYLSPRLFIPYPFSAVYAVSKFSLPFEIFSFGDD